MTYRLHPKSGVILISSGEHIPPTRSDARWVNYLNWVKAGNIPAPAEVDLEDINHLYSRVRSNINAERDRREQDKFTFMGRPVDSNMVSVIRISGAAGTAQAALALGLPFEMDWTCADDSTMTLDAYGVIGMLATLAEHSDLIHRHARVLKAQIDEMLEQGDREGLESFDVTQGWPNT